MNSCVKSNLFLVNDSPATKDYNLNGCVKLDIASSGTDAEFVAEVYPIRLLRNLHSLRKDSRFCDVNIAVQNEIFRVSDNDYTLKNSYYFNHVNIFRRTVRSSQLVVNISTPCSITV